jgi:hypothetical protein
MATPKQEMQALRLELTIANASLQTKKSSKQTALDISTDPKASAERRAEFKARYQKLVGEVNDLEDKIDSTKKRINKIKAGNTLAKYDKAEGQQKISDIKEQYALLSEAYKLDEDPGIKSKIDNLIQDYKDVYTSVIGTPISLAAARAELTKVVPTFGAPTTAGIPEAVVGGPSGTPAQKPKVTTGGTTGGVTGGTTGGRTGGVTGGTTGGNTSGSTGGASTTAFPQYDGVDTTTLAGITAASARPPVGGAVVSKYDSILAKAQADYNLPDIIFSNVKSLGDLLKEYVDGKIDIDLFKQKVANDPWYRQNSTEIKARYLQKFNYQDLVKSGNAKGTTDYEQKIAQITNDLIKQSRTLGAVIDEGQAKLIAEDLYIHNQDADESVKTRRLVNFIRPMAGMIGGKITEDFSGLALQNYQGLQKLAKQNGLKLENILPPGIDGKPATAEETLKRLALGEIDPTRLAQDVRKLAAIGQPQFVRDLLGQGINLEDVYAPYKRTMANILELDEGQIDLTDPTLRMGINDKGDVNLYDYSKALRQDSRWQYTGKAREEVSDAALTVLRNFGFQG